MVTENDSKHMVAPKLSKRNIMRCFPKRMVCALCFLMIIFIAQISIVLDISGLFKEKAIAFESDRYKNGCPSNSDLAKDFILKVQENITHIGRMIPNVIHFFVQSKCVPIEIMNHIQQHWKSLDNYSIKFHDAIEIDQYLAREDRKDLLMIPQAAKYAFDSTFKADLAKLVILWDQGGLAVDIDLVPGPAFLNGTIIANDDECVFEVDGNWVSSPHFVACKPKHPVLYTSILTAINAQAMSIGAGANHYEHMRSKIYWGHAAQFYGGRDNKIEKLRKTQGNNFLPGTSTVSLINTNRTAGALFNKLAFSDELMTTIHLLPSGKHPLVDLNSSSYKVDVATLLELDKGYSNQQNKMINDTACPAGLTHVQSNYNPASTLVKGRKIPNIVHITSKSKCFTESYANNIDLWRFNGYSLFLHDDEAVSNLLDRAWPEFPLLQEIRPCINSGAGLADLWRYVMIWEYGGVFTDMDNAPGPMFANGAIIEDSTDSLFEQERGGFPSQYFFAASPHHPIMYYMVNTCIQRLLDIKSIRSQYIPFVTGPGATKNAMIHFMGEGYPKQGEYRGLFINRNVTMIGNPQSSKRGVFVKRDSTGAVKAADILKMNMTHFSSAKVKQLAKTYSCLSDIYLKDVGN